MELINIVLKGEFYGHNEGTDWKKSLPWDTRGFVVFLIQRGQGMHEDR